MAKCRPGYANFALTDPPLKLVLLEGEAGGETRMDHLGVEVESSEIVHAAADRLAAAELTTRAEEQATCCYAVQDKVWATGPGQEPWEVYTVTADTGSDLEGQTEQERSVVGGDGTCCTTTEAETCCEPDAKSSCCTPRPTDPRRASPHSAR